MSPTAIPTGHRSAPTPSLSIGPCPTAILSSAVAFPPDPTSTPDLLARLAPDLPPARREALLAHLETDLGVRSRAHLATHADPLTLPLQAARSALAAAGRDVCAVLLATSTPSRWTTAESARLCSALGLDVAFADLRSGCTGGLWALVEGARLARDSGAAVLVVASDSFSRAFPPTERLAPIAMGDGAAALVLAPHAPHPPHASGDRGLVRAVFGGQPELVELATVSARLPPTGDEAFTLAGDPERFASAAEAALVAGLEALRPASGALLVPHVARLATARRLAARFDLPLFADGFIAHGNLGAASLLTALHLLRSRPGPTMLALASAGGGLSFGGALWIP